jgi:hypothetical protein
VSQYPYPPQQPPPPQVPYGYGYYPNDPLNTLLAPAKRASVFMFIMCGFMIPCGLLVSLLAGILKGVDRSQLPIDQQAAMAQAEQQFSGLGLSMPAILMVLGITSLIFGILLLVLAVFVRRGGIGAAVASIIFCCLLVLVAGLSVAGGVIEASQGESKALAGSCLWGVFLIMLICTVVFLFQAARNSGKVNAFRMAGYAAMQQQYAAGAGQQYGAHPSQQPQAWQQPGVGQWGQPAWPPPQQQPPQQQQNWPPPAPPGPST